MADLPSPYIGFKPGELITAKGIDDMQGMIKDDIGNQIKQAVNGITKVASAGDSDKLGGQTPGDLTDAILKKVLEEIPSRTGYRMYFKRLSTGEEKVIEHGLAACPLVDIYQLDYFQVVCASGEQRTPRWVNFYLYHTSEKRIRLPGPPAVNIEIEPTEKVHPFKVPLLEMLDRLKIQYTDATSLADLVNDFWSALFKQPNDEFDQDQYCHSPWFDRCCYEENASIKMVRDRGDLDDIWFKWMPKKTINYPVGTVPTGTQAIEMPQNILVKHFDFNTLGIEMLQDPVYATGTAFPSATDINEKELKVMVLLKV